MKYMSICEIFANVLKLMILFKGKVLMYSSVETLIGAEFKMGCHQILEPNNKRSFQLTLHARRATSERIYFLKPPALVFKFDQLCRMRLVKKNVRLVPEFTVSENPALES